MNPGETFGFGFVQILGLAGTVLGLGLILVAILRIEVLCRKVIGSRKGGYVSVRLTPRKFELDLQTGVEQEVPRTVPLRQPRGAHPRGATTHVHDKAS